MTRRWWVVTLLPAAALATVGPAVWSADPPADRENVEAALRLTRAAAAEYAIRVGDDEKPLDLKREPILRWSNPEAGDVHGNVFLWTRGERPLAIGSLFKWFGTRATMEHEFHSLAEGPVSARFHGDAVWATKEAGLRFADVPKAPAPVATDAQRLLQLKQLAKEFTGVGKFGTNPNDLELRLLPQPVYRYAAPEQGILSGGLFAFVRATDPEIVLLIEARGKDAAGARWQFAAARMHSIAELRLRHQNQPVWESGAHRMKDVFETHELPYTAFRFKDVPDFLKDALARPKP